MEQDVNTNIDDYTQGIVNSEKSDVSYAQENLPNGALVLDQNHLDYDNSAERRNENNDLDSARVADNNSDKSDNNDCSATITIEDDNNSTVEDLDANFCERISDIGTSTATHSKDTKGRMFVS